MHKPFLEPPPPPLLQGMPPDDGDVLGIGNFSTVYKNQWRGMVVAIKNFTPSEKITQQTIEKAIKFAEHEIAIHSRLQHPHIVIFHGTLSGPPRAIIMELMTHCLFKLITRRPYLLNKNDETCLAAQIALAIEFIHSKDIVHCDIKSDNILITQDGITKLGDFGLAKQRTLINDPHGQRRGTDGWMAPELAARRRPNSNETDIFAYGATLWEVYTQGRAPSVTAINSFLITPPEKLSLMTQIMADCLHPDPTHRPDAGQLVHRLQQFCSHLGINPQTYRIDAR
jgi:serine/threonine protein kinase